MLVDTAEPEFEVFVTPQGQARAVSKNFEIFLFPLQELTKPQPKFVLDTE
jgi:hypothetical protein